MVVTLPTTLASLGARIHTEHLAAKAAIKEGLGRGMAAGELLIKAKEQLKHGEWLPWLTQHCDMSKRTAQFYMELARNRAEIEAKSATVAHLTLQNVREVISPASNIKQLGRMAIDQAAKWRDGLTAAEQAAVMAGITAPSERILLDDIDLGLRQRVAANLARHPGQAIEPMWRQRQGGKAYAGFNPRWYSAAIDEETAALMVAERVDRDPDVLATAAAAPDDAARYAQVSALVGAPKAVEAEIVDDDAPAAPTDTARNLVSRLRSAFARKPQASINAQPALPPPDPARTAIVAAVDAFMKAGGTIEELTAVWESLGGDVSARGRKTG